MSLPKIPTVCQQCGSSYKDNCVLSLGERTPLSIDIICRNWLVTKATWCNHKCKVV